MGPVRPCSAAKPAAPASSSMVMPAAVMHAATARAAARAAIAAGRPLSSPLSSSLLRPVVAGPAPTPASSSPLLCRAAATTAQQQSSGADALYTGPPRVCILGGGFGGLYTAVKLEALLWPRGGGSGSSSSSSSSPLKPRVMLVDKGDRFVFKPLLYELLNGGATAEEVAPTFAQLLAPYDVRFVRARVAAVEEEEKDQEAAATNRGAAPWRAGEPRRAAGRVLLDSGESVEYDYLVVALGAEADARGVPGVRERAVPFVSLEDALRVRATLERRVLPSSSATASTAQTAPRQRTVVVVGAGYSGVELATVLAERVRAEAAASSSSSLSLCPPPRVQLVTPGADILEGSPAGQREAARRALSSLGVEVLTGVRVARLGPVEEDDEAAAAASSSSPSSSSPNDPQPLEPCTVHYEASDASSSSRSAAWKQRADLVVWTAGSAPVTAAAAADAPKTQPLFPSFPTTPRGTIATEPSLRVVGHPRAFALGDVATATQEDPYASAGPVGDPDDPARRGAGSGAAGAASSAPPPLPATAQVAFQQADYAAWNLWASITGRPLLPFRYQHLGSMMALGAAQAAVALPVELPADAAARLRRSPLGAALALAGVRVGNEGGEQEGGQGGNDSAAGVTIEGPLAQLLRRGAYLYRQPTGEQRLAVAASWLQQAAAAAASVAAAAAAGAGPSSSSSPNSRGR